MALNKLAEAALKLGSGPPPLPGVARHVLDTLEPIELTPSNDAGMWHAAKNTVSRLGRSLGGGGESFLKAFDRGYGADPNGAFLGNVQRGIGAGTPAFLKRFWDEGGTSALLGIGGMGLAGYGAKKLYDEHIKKQDPYAGMYPPVG